jgi:hypothetical protein
LVAQLTKSKREALHLHNGQDLRDRGVAYLTDHPEHAQQSALHYQTLLYSDPAALLRGAGVWADTATGLQGIETWLNAHPALFCP